MNNKTKMNETKFLLCKMRGEPYVSESKGTTKHELSVRDMLKITRKLNEDIQPETDQSETDQEKPVNKKNVQDQANEEKKFKDSFPLVMTLMLILLNLK